MTFVTDNVNRGYQMKNKFDMMLDGQHKGSFNFKDLSNRQGSTNFPIFNNQR